MKDTQLKKLNRVVRKLADEVAALRKLIRRELLNERGRGSAGTGERKAKKEEKGKKKRKTEAGGEPGAAPPAA